MVAWNNPFKIECGWKMHGGKEQDWNFLFVRKHLWMVFMIFFKLKCLFAWIKKVLLELVAHFSIYWLGKLVNECQRNSFFFIIIDTNPSTFSYCSNCVCILCFLVSFPWHFYLHKVVFAYDSVLWNNLQLTVIFNGLKMYLQSHWIIFDSLIGSSVFEELNKSSSICGFLSFL